MSSRRVPLANNPNAANSPYRASTASKRQRGLVDEFPDHERNPSPPKKRQLVEFNSNGLRQHISIQDPECNSHPDKQPTARDSLKRKLLATRETKQPAQRAPERNEAGSTAEKDLIRTWRKHYRKVFPTYVFYFDNLPDDVCLKASRQVTALGAKEEKFFSRNVSHVVTTRNVLSKAGEASHPEGVGSTRAHAAQGSNAHNSTINPSLLDKHDGSQAAPLPHRTRQVWDGQNQKRQQMPWQDIELRRHQGGGNDILHKARELGIKVWPMEKFERTIMTLISREPDEEVTTSRRARERLQAAKGQKNADLQQLLHNERNNAPTERAPWQEIVPFRGYYIYVHDMDERVKPVMARDYAKPAEGEEGEWPMLHSVSKGRCPFIPEPTPEAEQQAKQNHTREGRRKDQGREEAKQIEKQEERVKARKVLDHPRAEKANPRQNRETGHSKENENSNTNVERALPQIVKQSVEQGEGAELVKVGPSAGRARPSGEYPRTRSTTRSPQKPPLQDDLQTANCVAQPAMPAPPVKPLNPPSLSKNSSNMEGMPPNLGSAQAWFRGTLNHHGGEPMASGVRPNITSAIRSQMISSTAAAPNAKAGTSKQMHQLNRRVLERQSGLSANSNPSSVNVNDVRAAINAERAPVLRRTTRQQATQTMARIREEEAVTEDQPEPKANTRGGKASEEKDKSATAKKESKPGYCENCREKFDDFQEHVNTRKHKKFASEPENWAELDNLLKKLVRR
ncbi:MAG: hypothetical protein M1831_004106 [Alyxoria varia]|nr:MAG: hypothetical protein M1831_004106 [Alyxoria varia]